jgi:hypothetical protein
MIDWQPIATAPRDGSNILLWLGGPEQRAVVGHFRHTALWGDCWEYDGEHTVKVDDDVRHWMPLPEGPQATSL